jgi:hypothetical protein
MAYVGLQLGVAYPRMLGSMADEIWSKTHAAPATSAEGSLIGRSPAVYR